MMHNTEITSDATVSSPLAVDGPQPAWMTLNEARQRAFTGEVVFEVDPEVFAYLDAGVVYYAERASDAPLGRRLLEAGVVSVEQLERGTVRVGDVEHLGRLFDRDPSVDRDAVLVVTETATEMLIAEVANDATATVRVTAYRHHPSGLHRWFVGTGELGIAARQVAPVGPIDHALVEELPPVAATEDLTIEWDDLDAAMSSAEFSVEPDELAFFDPFAEDEYIPLAPELIETPVDDMVEPVFDDEFAMVEEHGRSDQVELTEHVDETVWIEEDARVEQDDDDLDDTPPDSFDFRIKWPDGSEEAAVPPVDPAEQSVEPTADAMVESVDHVDGSTSSVAPPQAAPFVETEDGELRFDMPPLRLTDDGQDEDADVPDDVAEAVRRAISAIESASADPAIASDPLVDIEPAHDEEVAHDAIDDRSGEAWEVTTEVAAVAAPAPGAFAPPTMDTRAEVMYAREAGEDSTPTDPTQSSIHLPPAHAVASVVFVDDDPSSGGGSDERSSALRRLIGSLRRKDH